MNDDKEIFLPDTTVKYGNLKKVLKKTYGLELKEGVDVLELVISTILIYGGIQYRKVLPSWLSIGLVAFGGYTLIKNAKNYIESRKKNE